METSEVAYLIQLSLILQVGDCFSTLRFFLYRSTDFRHLKTHMLCTKLHGCVAYRSVLHITAPHHTLFLQH